VFKLRIDSAGRTLFDSRPIAQEQLVSRLERFQRDHDQTAIRIIVDAGAPASAVESLEQCVRGSVKSGTEIEIESRQPSAISHQP